jgi:hypothetical protein
VFVAELLQRHLTALRELETYWWGAPLLALICCATPLWRWLRARGAGAAEFLVFAAVCTAGVAFAWSLLWASDDAYITFRYAENLVKGHGLVYNPGERVEGYTDFLWALYAALAIELGGDPGRWGIFLNLASFVGVLICLERLGRRQRSVAMPVGIAVILFAANYSAASFATAALETMFAAFLATLALERADAGRPLSAGVAGSLAVLSHPDHGIFYAALAAALFFERDRWQKLVRYSIPFAVSFLPYFAWRYAYYGDWMPNTFYAKSASSLHLDQGLKYSALTFFGSALWALAPLVLLGAYRARRSLVGRYSLLVLAIYPAYVIKVGGDFMLGRFFVPGCAGSRAAGDTSRPSRWSRSARPRSFRSRSSGPETSITASPTSARSPRSPISRPWPRPLTATCSARVCSAISRPGATCRRRRSSRSAWPATTGRSRSSICAGSPAAAWRTCR